MISLNGTKDKYSVEIEILTTQGKYEYEFYCASTAQQAQRFARADAERLMQLDSVATAKTFKAKLLEKPT